MIVEREWTKNFLRLHRGTKKWQKKHPVQPMMMNTGRM